MVNTRTDGSHPPYHSDSNHCNCLATHPRGCCCATHRGGGPLGGGPLAGGPCGDPGTGPPVGGGPLLFDTAQA